MIEALNGKTGIRDSKPNLTPKRDMLAKEADHIDLGDRHLMIHTAPGHTPGNVRRRNRAA